MQIKGQTFSRKVFLFLLKPDDGLSGDFPARSLARCSTFLFGDDVARLQGGVSADLARGLDELRNADHRRGDGVGRVEEDERAILSVGGGELVDALADLLRFRGLQEHAIGRGGGQEEVLGGG